MSGRAPDPRDDEISAAVTAIWKRSRESSLARLAALEEAVAALAEGRLSEEARRTAEHEAHRLAGSAGTFGFHLASAAAQQLEWILAGTEPVPEERIRAAVEHVAVIRADLQDEPTQERDLEF